MKKIFVMALGSVCFAASALAQAAPTNASTSPAAITNPNNPAKTTAAPVPGANSFTETEVRSRLEKHGYTKIADLSKDGNSIWRGQATKDGKAGEVAVDYQGNISFQ